MRTDSSDGGGGRTGDADATGDRRRPVVELRDVVREYETGGETVRALDSVSLSVRPGESVAVIGPSGSGKSTMLNVLGLLDAPDSGQVRLAGRDVTDIDDRARTNARKDAIGFVFQDFFLLPTLTAVENVEVPTMFDRADAGGRAADLLEQVGLGDRLRHRPDELSGGQKQRVAIARSLINRPAVVLADEPTGNLDRETGTRILELFDRVRDRGVAVITVTHDPLVTDYAERTVELVDGRIASREGPEGPDAGGAGGDADRPEGDAGGDGEDRAGGDGEDRAGGDGGDAHDRAAGDPGGGVGR